MEAGLDPDAEFATKSREQRVMKVAALIAKRALDAMRHYDQNPPKKKKGK
jgi:hypothetical protein